jgi:ELWxxDGT repeat protein
VALIAGTFQFPQSSGALNGGVSYITAYNGEVVFEDIDSSSEYGLWVTNGTAAGTFELGGIGNSGIAGANPDGLQPMCTCRSTTARCRRDVERLALFLMVAVRAGDDTRYPSIFTPSLICASFSRNPSASPKSAKPW